MLLYFVESSFRRSGRVMGFDEPDNYVSLRELQPWLQRLTRTVEDDASQVFVASHNPEVIDYLATNDAWLFERTDGGPASVRPLPIDPDSMLKASEQIARGLTDAA
jgi:predicted ATPase